MQKLIHGLSVFFILRMVSSAVLNIFGRILEDTGKISIFLFILALIIAGYDIFIEAFKELFHGNIFAESMLITIVAAAACLIGELEEAATIVLLFQLGESFQDISVDYSMEKIKSSSDLHINIDKYKNERKLMKRFSSIYMPATLGLALICFIIFILTGMNIDEAVRRALVIIVAACPCAIVISVPLAYSAGIAAGAGNNVFFKGDNAIDIVSCSNSLSVNSEKDGCIELQSGDNTVAVIRSMKEKTALNISKLIAVKTRKTATFNMFLALALKVIVIIFGITGNCPVWIAVFADAGIALITIIISLSLLKLNFAKKIRLQ